MTHPLLSLEHVSRRFDGGRHGLGALSLDIARGSFVSIVGPSGCGKSTLLRLVAGLDAPEAGRLSWPLGRPGEIGFVFQDATLMPWATVFDNVWLPHRLNGVSREDARARVVDALERVGLADRRDAYPRQLSGGMRMRVSIARALSLKPDVLLMDEPFAALDEITRERLNEELNDLWAEHGWTVLYVTHSVYEAVFLSTRVLVLPGRPGPLLADMEVPGPEDRGDAWRADGRFAALSASITAHLRAASGDGGTS